jgi:hypothetical protein
MKRLGNPPILLLAIGVGLVKSQTFTMAGTRSDKLVRESQLYQDLDLNHRDAMYRAMTFIARRGGPPPPGDKKDVLTAHRARARAWLLAQEEPGDLLAIYESFRRSWNPVFLD